MRTNHSNSSIAGTYDSHFHLSEMKRKGLHPESVFSELFLGGWKGGLDAATGVEDFEERLAAIKDFPRIRLSAGLYPSETEKPWKDKIIQLKRQLTHPRVVAVGEIGIDGFRSYGSAEKQRELFLNQLILADEFALPVLVHSRTAEDEVFSAIKEAPPSKGGVLHCFSGSFESAERFLDFNFYISFAGNLTYPKNSILRETAKRLPLNRILAETDSPYLPPQARRGELNTPGGVCYIYEALAAIRGMTFLELLTALEENIFRCFPRMH